MNPAVCPAGIFAGDSTIVVLFIGCAYHTPPFLFYVHDILLTNANGIFFVGYVVPHSAFAFVCQSRGKFTFDDIYVFPQLVLK